MKQPKIRYFLESKSPNLDERVVPELIMAEVSYGYAKITKNGNRRNSPFRISLQVSTLPSKFGLIKNNFKYDGEVFQKANKNNNTIKNKMVVLEEGINKLTSKYDIERKIPTPKEFKLALEKYLGRVTILKKPQQTILEYFYGKIEKKIEDSDKNKKSSIDINTIKTYKTVSHHIENYQIATNEVLTFEDFDETKYWKYWEVLDDIVKGEIVVFNPNQPKKRRITEYGYLINSLRKYQVAFIGTLKKALKEGNKMPLDVYDENLIVEKKEASKNIYVTEEELQKIISTNVDFDYKMQRAKDYMILGCLTGMRFESMFDTKNTIVELFEDDDYNFKYIHSKQNKTSTEVYMPLLAPVKNVLKMYNNEFPLVKSNAVINKDIKKLFEHLNIDSLEDVTYITFRNGTINLKKPKHEIITTHDCKKTFYTNLFNNGVLPTAIDNMTHPDATPKNRMAKIYNKATMLDKAKMFVDEINKIGSDIYKF